MTEIKNKQSTRGVLLANLGTPEAPEKKPVARFLREFLSDPRVIDLPRYLWLPLLNLVIIPFRAGRSAEAYRKIWWPEGSPLLVLTERLAERVAEVLPADTRVEIGMRYGEPAIKNRLERLKRKGVDELIVIPLYPQFSHTTTSSIYDAVDAALDELDWHPVQRRIEEYHVDAAWVAAVATSISDFQSKRGRGEKLLFSMHGIPERYVEQGDPYRAHCEASVKAVADRLGLPEDAWILTYQSRVGREPWLQPYTDITLQELARDGIEHVQVVCPGFAVDCLETLEEIAMQNEEAFEAAGGKKLDYIPALNDSAAHAEVFRVMIESIEGENHE